MPYYSSYNMLCSIFFSPSQEELSELKEQICLYESVVKRGVLSVEVTGGDVWENQLSDSYVDLGIKKTRCENGRIHRYAM